MCSRAPKPILSAGARIPMKGARLYAAKKKKTENKEATADAKPEDKEADDNVGGEMDIDLDNDGDGQMDFDLEAEGDSDVRMTEDTTEDSKPPDDPVQSMMKFDVDVDAMHEVHE